MRRLLIALLLIIAVPSLASAQSDLPPVPPEFYDGWRRVGSNEITYCIDLSSPTLEFNRQAGAAIADALLLGHAYFEIDPTYPIDAQGYLEDLFVWLTDDCDAFMGVSLGSTTLPGWMTITRPYASFRYVLVAADENIATLRDVPLDALIGSQMVSAGDRALIAFLQARPEADRWRRIPYADNALMLERLKDGTLGAMLMWEPTLFDLTDGDPAAAGVHIIDPAPFQDTWVAVGMVLRQQEAFVREQIDAAIEALVDDGTFAALLEQTGVPGSAGGLEDR